MTVRNRRKGFTLIELLVVVVIIGILAAVAVSKFADTRGAAITASMKSDLKNLIPTAEAEYSANQSYAGVGTPVGSNGSTIAFTGTATGWTATATNGAGREGTCSIAVGSGANSVDPLAAEGVVACQ